MSDCKTSLKLSRLIKNTAKSVDSFSLLFVDFMNRSSSIQQENYAMVIRNAFSAGKNGVEIELEECEAIMPRVEKLCDIVNNKGNAIAKTICCESLAHRYADMWYFTRDDNYEKKCQFYYNKCHEIALQNQYWKNVDSSIYWLAVANHRMNLLDEAKKTYLRVATRGSPRFLKSTSFRRKIVAAYVYSRPEVDLVHIDSISQIDSLKHPKYIDIYNRVRRDPDIISYLGYAEKAEQYRKIKHKQSERH